MSVCEMLFVENLKCVFEKELSLQLLKKNTLE